jgi:hypothetical protein
MMEDTARSQWLPGYQQQSFRQFVIDSFLCAQTSAGLSVQKSLTLPYRRRCGLPGRPVEAKACFRRGG